MIFHIHKRSGLKNIALTSIILLCPTIVVGARSLSDGYLDKRGGSRLTIQSSLSNEKINILQEDEKNKRDNNILKNSAKDLQENVDIPQTNPSPSMLQQVGSAASTIFLTTSRLAFTGVKGAFYSLTPLGYGCIWTLEKTCEAITSTATNTSSAVNYTLDSIQDIREGKARKRDKAYDAAVRTLSTSKDAAVWIVSNLFEGGGKAIPPLARGSQWLWEELWDSSTTPLKLAEISNGEN